jgi:hypothetical protein
MVHTRKQPEHTKSQASGDNGEQEVRADGVCHTVDQRAKHACGLLGLAVFGVVLPTFKNCKIAVERIEHSHQRYTNDENGT